MRLSVIKCYLKNAIVEELLDLLKNNIETIINNNNNIIIKIRKNKEDDTNQIIKTLDPENYVITILD